MAAKTDTSVLMFIEQERVIMPVSSFAFRVAQGSRRRLGRYKGAVVVHREGKAVPIEDIEVIKVWGSSLWQKIVSRLTGVWEIKTKFAPPVPMSLDEFREMVARYLRYDSERGDPFLPQNEPLENVIAAIKKAKSYSDVFELIHVPDPQDCLDVL